MSWAVAGTLCLAACAVGPDYSKPLLAVPDSFKEGSGWQRSQANPQASISSLWWLDYHDDTLTDLIDQSLKANQSIAAAEAAYRVAKAIVDANTAGLFPTVGAGISGSRGRDPVSASIPGATRGPVNLVNASVSASWELDLWGQIRREIESAKASAQASDAQLAGQRLSISASVAINYFALRQADIDIALLKQQQEIDSQLFEITRSGFALGTQTNDDVLFSQNTLQVAIANLQTSEAAREQYEHAIAVLLGQPPAAFTLPPRNDYAFATPAVPLGLPSQLLQRRYDVVSAERTAASANARIGVAKAAFFPNLTLSAQGGYQHTALANLFSVPNRFWTLGPDLAGTLFDGGARTAAVRQAEATFDQEVANYRLTVLSAFQSVEDSLSSHNHLRQQEQAYAEVFQRNQTLFGSQEAQLQAGTASRQNVLTQRLLLLQAEQSLRDTQGALAQNSITLIKSLGGGWQWDEQQGAAVTAGAPAAQVPAATASGSPPP